MRKTHAAPWGNRIVGTGELPAGQFLANPANWRIHPTFQQDQMDVILHEVGFVQGVIVNKRTSDEWEPGERNVETLVDGELRVKRALARGEDTLVPVVYVDLSPAEERAVLATFDPISGLAGKDEERQRALAQEVAADFADSDLDIAAILKTEKAPSRGLRHEVKECTCCQKKCSPRCGCYREEQPKRRKKR